MKKRHRSSLASALLATALVGFGALPALATNPLDSFANDILNQTTPSTPGHNYELTVLPYAPDMEAKDGFYVGLTTGFISDCGISTCDPNNHTYAVSSSFQMFCDDFNNTIFPPATYDIYIRNIATPAGMLSTDTPVPNPPSGIGLTYGELQLQALLGVSFGTTQSNNADEDGNIQEDIWNISISDPHAKFSVVEDMQTLLNNANNSLPTATFNNAYMFDIEGNPLGQAFMPVVPGGFNNSSSPPTPEPGTLAMLGLGLIGLGSLKLRKRQR
jgi:hypothetical protein